MSTEIPKEQQEIAARLKQARIKAGYRTAREFCDKNDIKQPTYSNHENGKRGLKRPVAKHYAALLGVSDQWLLDGVSEDTPPPSHLQQRHEQSTNGHNQSLGFFSITNARERRLEVHGVVAAGLWREDVGDMDALEIIDWVDTAGLPYENIYGHKVEGTSMNRVFPHGHYLVCVSLAELGREPFDGEFVIVTRRSEQGLFERTAKLFKIGAHGPELWPYSHDPKFQEPLHIPDNGEEDSVQIQAIVLTSTPGVLLKG